MYRLGLYLFALCFLLAACERDDRQTSMKLELTPIMNLLENGSCESWSDDFVSENNYLIGWSLREHYGSIIREGNRVYEGKYAVRMSSLRVGLTASISQKIRVMAGRNLRIRFHYYIEEPCTGTKPRMYCYFRDGNLQNISNEVLSTFYDEATWGIIRGGGYGLSYFPLEYNDWKLFDYVIQVPTIADYFVFEIHTYAGTIMYVDDCWVVDLDMYN